jgi:hypothetical protein
MGEPMIPYYNLSRGTLCGPPKDARYCRIQSTWLEQKRWEDVLLAVPVDMYYHLAQGHKIIVHDQSEKPRLSRAQWQGLSWIRFATNIAWYEASPAEFSRGWHARQPVLESAVRAIKCACAHFCRQVQGMGDQRQRCAPGAL